MIIKDIKGYSVLDSTGLPTIEVEMITSVKEGKIIRGTGSAPRGSTVGKYECIQKYNKRADSNLSYVDKSIDILKSIKKYIINRNFDSLEHFDKYLIELDGTENKANLGGNLTLALSIAFLNLYSNFHSITKINILGDIFNTPKPIINIIDGGINSKIKGIEILLIPLGLYSFEEYIISAKEFQIRLEKKLISINKPIAYSHQGANFYDSENIIEPLMVTNDLLRSLRLDNMFSIGLDLAVSDHYTKGKYCIPWISENPLNTDDLILYYQNNLQPYDISYIEDGFFEEDIKGWKHIQKSFPNTLISGDDLYASNLERLDKFSDLANSIVIKPNQIGTISETIDCIKVANSHNKIIIISQRTSEIEDNLIADLCLSNAVEYSKFGGLNRNDRLSKYNHILRETRKNKNE